MTSSRRTDFADRHLERWSDLFPDPDSRKAHVEGALIRINDLIKRNERGLRGLLTDDPLNYEEFVTLHALLGGNSRGEPTTPAKLAERTGVTRAGMTSRLDRLVDQGLVTRTPDDEDRRRILVEATTDGEAAWSRTLDAWGSAEQSLFEALSDRDLKQLNTILRKVSPTAKD